MNTESDHKTRHIPHRINLLITYRERFFKLTAKQRDQVRDLDRCAKDMSGMMIRFLMDEMGIFLSKGDCTLSERKPRSKYCAPPLTLALVQQDQASAFILEALKFANRAIAHIEDTEVDHHFRSAVDDVRLVKAIDYTESKIIEHIYGTGEEYVRVMNLPNNDMHRERLDLSGVTAQLVKKGSKPISA